MGLSSIKRVGQTLVFLGVAVASWQGIITLCTLSLSLFLFSIHFFFLRIRNKLSLYYFEWNDEKKTVFFQILVFLYWPIIFRWILRNIQLLWILPSICQVKLGQLLCYI